MVCKIHRPTQPGLAAELKAVVSAGQPPIACRIPHPTCYQAVAVAGSSRAGVHCIVLHIHFDRISRVGWQNELWESLSALPTATGGALTVEGLQKITVRIRIAFDQYQDHGLREGGDDGCQ